MIAIVSLHSLATREVNPMIPSPISVLLYVVFLGCGVAIMYSLMICLSATSIWLGRNQTLYNFWFYITNFSRYPMEIYNRRLGKTAVRIFHVRGAGAVGRQRPRAITGQADRPAHHRRNGCLPAGPWWRPSSACWQAAGSLRRLC